MKLIVNGEALEVRATTLAALLKELDYEGGWLATALNGDVVPAAERAELRVNEGDRIEILSPMQGG
ncbi:MULTISPECIES: sulfur carrier protein ThiS [unclassified Mesorhizobium]|uniref:sulfur carrier protein ThiS n=1 Tax=unclassified Mesorhizobium TaxID=325217 RepID=UPI002417D581|nr:MULTISPECIES: sulfur carrier protein ThiS [unclassified Mesorhizobium]MDG4880105.1 sulfur carrier protein ThiS [Mesorhizobium sp. WSM4884]WFP60314.1 sulfur carrier protein ThiS [Mesorhizobium sp. WSM4904]WFP73542.1 sulfur carrier protein ThiS [Mesorhizobium sp. WSM4906]